MTLGLLKFAPVIPEGYVFQTIAFIALTLFVWRQEEHPALKIE